MTATATIAKPRKVRAPKPVVSDFDAARAQAVEYLAAHGTMPVWREGSWAQGETPTVERTIDTIEAWESDPRGGGFWQRGTKAKAAGTNQPADPEAKARHEEALAYVRSYVGTWGLPLDIRADRKWGTKYLKLTVGQVNALLAGKARDAERAAAAVATRHPRYAEAVAVIDAAVAAGRLSDFMASMNAKRDNLSERMVEALLRNAPVARPDAPTAPAAPAITEGMWLLDGAVIKVQAAIANGSGNLYAKRLDPETGEFVYTAGLIRRMAGAVKMTIEQAGEFGKLYGRCIRCGRELTDEYSIANGIGKVCAGKGDWA